MVESNKAPRVPSFIQFPNDKPNNSKIRRSSRARKATQKDLPYKTASETPTKRKRKSTTSKPNKKHTKTSRNANDFEDDPLDEELNAKDEIWIGAAFQEGQGSYCIYFGEKDTRNKSAFVAVPEIDMLSVDSIYILATAEAIEKSTPSTLPLVIYTSCRDLPRAIYGGIPNGPQSSSIDRIRRLIKEKDNQVQVRHVSSRHMSKEQNTAVELAVNLLNNRNSTVEESQQDIMEMSQTLDSNMNETHDIKEPEAENMEIEKLEEETPLILEEIKQVENNVIMEEAEQIEEEQPVQEAVQEAAQEAVQEAVQESFQEAIQESVQEVVQEPVQEEPVNEKYVKEEYVKEELVKEECINGEPEKEVVMQEILPKEAPVLARESSWSSMFGSIWDALSSPFKSQK